MPTRFYLPASGSPPVTPPALPSGWIDQSPAHYNAPAPTTKSNTAFTDIAVNDTTASVANVAVGCYVSAPLAAQTISGTLSAVVMAFESVSSADDSLNVGAYVIAGDGSSVVGTLYAGHTAALQVVTNVGVLGQELDSGQFETRIIPAQAITSTPVTAGQRLMILVGYRTHDVSATARSSSLRVGDPSATADQALTADLITNLVPWVELSGTVTFASGTTPVSSDLDLRWRVATKVSSDLDLRWRVATKVSSELDLRWRVATMVSSDLDLRWRVATQVSSDLDARWRVYNRLTSDVDLRWRVATRVTSDIDLRWRTAVRITSDLDLRWRQWSSATSDLDLRWVANSSLLQVTSDLDLRWLVRNRVTSDADLRWRVAGQVASDVDLRWLVYGSVSSDLTLGWVVHALAVAIVLPVDVFVALAPQRGAVSLDPIRVSVSLD